MELHEFSARELVNALQAGEVSALDCVSHFVNRSNAASDLNAWVDVDGNSNATYHELARVKADSIDQDRGSNSDLLSGIPIAIKDGICTRGGLTTAASKMLGTFRSPDDANCVVRLKENNAVVLGKTNMDEFSMGSSTENSFWGATRNPFDLQRVPGGSSGGSAAAVAAGLVPWALGSDTGGSIRQPAAFCGITGLKPTYGRVSRRGLIAYASSLDQIGPMARSAEDCALLLNVIAGHDPLDSTSVATDQVDFLANLDESVEGLKIGVCPEFLGDGVDPQVAEAVDHALAKLESMGAKRINIELPNAKYAVASYYVIAPCEASSNLSRYDGVRYTYRHSNDSLDAMYQQTRAAGFGEEVKRRIVLGTFALSSGYYDAYYLNASRVRRQIKSDFENAFRDVDVIAGPTTPTTAFKLGENAHDPLSMYLADIFTVSANLAGIPAVSIPCGQDQDGMPVGLQLHGRMFDEATLLRVAHQYQQQTQWHLRRPTSSWGGNA